jgi:uncharacterized protein (TIGR00369 family)
MGQELSGEYKYCFACGAANPVGLHLKPEASDGKCVMRWEPKREYQGYDDVLHGGITATLLDEAMAYACLSVQAGCATAEMETRFIRPISTAKPIMISAIMVERRRRMLRAEAELFQDGEIMARATGKFVVAPEVARSS